MKFLDDIFLLCQLLRPVVRALLFDVQEVSPVRVPAVQGKFGDKGDFQLCIEMHVNCVDLSDDNDRPNVSTWDLGAVGLPGLCRARHFPVAGWGH